MKATRYLQVLWAVIGLALGTSVFAQAYPSKPVKMLVPFAPGGAVDIVGRVMAQALSSSTGQSFIVDNRAGGGGIQGGEAGARAAPDGYTLLTSTISFAVPMTSAPDGTPSAASAAVVTRAPATMRRPASKHAA